MLTVRMMPDYSMLSPTGLDPSGMVPDKPELPPMRLLAQAMAKLAGMRSRSVRAWTWRWRLRAAAWIGSVDLVARRSKMRRALPLDASVSILFSECMALHRVKGRPSPSMVW